MRVSSAWASFVGTGVGMTNGPVLRPTGSPYNLQAQTLHPRTQTPDPGPKPPKPNSETPNPKS